jgi:4-hydroxybenzoate polyprenyltransferase
MASRARFTDYLSLVKIQHSIFAFPFLLGGIFLAPGWRELGWLQWSAMLVAMVAARSAAMGFNRIVDAHLDARNPRTAAREIPSGKVSVGQGRLFVLLMSVLFVASAYLLNRFAFWASPVVLLLLFAYSYTKRFTWLCHYALGFGIGLAPTAGWVAITGSLAWPPLALSGALMFYISGFDLLYATQDVEFDREQELYSIPARFGVGAALWIARLSHLVSFGFFVWVGSLFPLGLVYWLGLALIGALMIWEHSLVKEEDLSRVPMAFFHANSLISLVVGLAIIGGVFFV